MTAAAVLRARCPPVPPTATTTAATAPAVPTTIKNNFAIRRNSPTLWAAVLRMAGVDRQCDQLSFNRCFKC